MSAWGRGRGVGRKGRLTLIMALITVTIALTTAMKQEVMAFTTLLNCGCR